MILNKLSLKIFLIVLCVFFISSYVKPGHTEEKPAETPKAAEPAPVDAAKVKTIIDTMMAGKRDGVDSVGGISGSKEAKAAKGIYSTFGGLTMKFAITFDQGTTDGNAYLLTLGGDNDYNIAKAAPFAGKVICLKYGGSSRYNGCDEVKTFGEYTPTAPK